MLTSRTSDEKRVTYPPENKLSRNVDLSFAYMPLFQLPTNEVFRF
jgi:hypothetical protein